MTTEVPQTRESHHWAVGAHLSALVALFGIPSLLGPLAVLLLRRGDPYVEAQAKEALNFNISFLIYGLVAAVSVLLLVGFIALPLVIVTWFVLVIVAAAAASRGEDYEYPFTIRFIN